MKMFGRRSASAAAKVVHAPGAEPARALTFRVAVAHTDEGHPSAVPAHWGPAYDAALADVVAHVKGVPVGEVDLLEQARIGLERARQENPPEDGWECWIEVHGADGWERVA